METGDSALVVREIDTSYYIYFMHILYCVSVCGEILVVVVAVIKH